MIGTEDDPTVPGYFAGDLHRAIKGSRLYMMKEGGHYSYRRNAAEYNAVVESFLKENTALGSARKAAGSASNPERTEKEVAGLATRTQAVAAALTTITAGSIITEPLNPSASLSRKE